MGRAPFQVIVFLYRRSAIGAIEYAIFRRADLNAWQAIAGGGEGNESPEAAVVDLAKRTLTPAMDSADDATRHS
jgi:dihydroneopterin triphosphate diphosphatase